MTEPTRTITLRLDSDDATVTVQTRAVTLCDDPDGTRAGILTHFESFLRGAGFCFDGHVQIVEEDSDG